MGPSPGNRRLHPARQEKIREARKRAKTRLLSNPAARSAIKRRAQAAARKTLTEREAVTPEQLAEWEAEAEEESTP